MTLLPYQRWLAIHMLELRDGRFRFRQVLILISRQNGKTFFLKLLALYMIYVGGARLVLGVAQSLDIAREAWQGACELAETSVDLCGEVATVRRANGEQCLSLVSGARYRIAAATRSAGRGLSVDLLIMDELREQRDWSSWSALSKTTVARPNAMIVGISNAGDDQSVVLNSLRATALAGTDEALGVFEWSAPDGCELDDTDAWEQANPGLGFTVSEAALRSAMNTDPPWVFRTESMCQRVEALDAAIDGASWSMCSDPGGTLGNSRDRVVACIDVGPGGHVSLCGAGVLPDGRVRVEVLEAWQNTALCRAELVTLLAQIAPAAVAWFPSGPAAELGAELRSLNAYELKGQEVAEACMELAGLVDARRVLHPSDPLLDAHVSNCAKLRGGDGWRFSRRAGGNVDAAYAAAGAIRVARTLPPPVVVPKSRVF